MSEGCGSLVQVQCTMARQTRMGDQGLHTLRNNPDIARFVIEGEANGRHLGTGSYGSVEEVSKRGSIYMEYSNTMICGQH